MDSRAHAATARRVRRVAQLAAGTLTIAVIVGAVGAWAPADGGALPSCGSPPRPAGAGTFGAGATDSPNRPGKVMARFGGRFSCPEGAEWWFEYGTTPAYGERTASNDAAVPVQDTGGSAVVRTDVDGLEYGQTYHHELVVRYPDGDIERGGDTFVVVRPGPLRPPQRVTVTWSRRPTPERTILDQVSVLDAAPGAKVTVSCRGPGSAACKPFERRIVLGSRPTVFRNWRLSSPTYLSVVIAGKGMPTETQIHPRPRSGPRLETFCGGYPVVLNTRCVDVTLQSAGPQVRRLAITDVTRGSRVDVASRGPGCPGRDLGFPVITPRDDPYARLSWRRYNRLRAGAVLRVFITRANTYGLTRSFRVTRSAVVGGSYRCLARTEPRRIVACPTSAPVSTGRG